MLRFLGRAAVACVLLATTAGGALAGRAGGESAGIGLVMCCALGAPVLLIAGVVVSFYAVRPKPQPPSASDPENRP